MRVIRTRDVTFDHTRFCDPADIDLANVLTIEEVVECLEMPVSTFAGVVIEEDVDQDEILDEGDMPEKGNDVHTSMKRGDNFAPGDVHTGMKTGDLLTCGCPFEWLVFFRQFGQWPGYSGEILDEPPVEVDESEKCLQLFQMSRCCPFDNSCNFLRVHTDTVSSYDYS